MLSVLTMCSQCAHWVYGPLSPVSIAFIMYYIYLLHRGLQQRSESNFVFSFLEFGLDDQVWEMIGIDAQ